MQTAERVSPAVAGVFPAIGVNDGLTNLYISQGRIGQRRHRVPASRGARSCNSLRRSYGGAVRPRQPATSLRLGVGLSGSFFESDLAL